MHKKGKLGEGLGKDGCMVGSGLTKESGLSSDKVEICFRKLNPQDFPGRLHVHEKMDEVVIVLRGRFVVEMDGETIELGEKDFVFKEAESCGRALSADKDTEVLIIKAPSVKNDVRLMG